MDLNTLFTICRKYGVEVSFNYDYEINALHISFIHKYRNIPSMWSCKISQELITEHNDPFIVGKVVIEEALRQMCLLEEGEIYEL